MAYYNPQQTPVQQTPVQQQVPAQQRPVQQANIGFAGQAYPNVNQQMLRQIDTASASKTTWATFVKTLIIVFGIIIFIGCGVFGFVFGEAEGGDMAVIGALLGVLVGIVSALLISCMGLFLVEMAQNLAKANDSINELKAEIRYLNSKR